MFRLQLQVKHAKVKLSPFVELNHFQYRTWRLLKTCKKALEKAIVLLFESLVVVNGPLWTNYLISHSLSERPRLQSGKDLLHVTFRLLIHPSHFCKFIKTSFQLSGSEMVVSVGQLRSLGNGNWQISGYFWACHSRKPSPSRIFLNLPSFIEYPCTAEY